MKLTILFVVVIAAILFWWLGALSPGAGFDPRRGGELML
jgi:hypothetical protein